MQEAVFLKEPGNLSIKEVQEAPAPGPGEARLRVHASGVCGTDLSGYIGKFPFYAPPLIPGHELGVEVLELGSGVEHLKVGDRCSLEPYLNCAEPDCQICQSGGTNCCPHHQTYGVHCDGGWQKTITYRADKLHPSPEQLEYEQLAVIETLAIGFHGVSRSLLTDGGWAVLRGAGPIGLSTLEAIKVKTDKIVVMDLDQQRLDFCRKTMGVEHVFQVGSEDQEQQALGAVAELTSGFQAEAVFDATGHPGSMRTAIEYVRHRGSLTFVGIAPKDVAFEHKKFHAREGTLFCSRNALPDDFRRLISLMETGRISTDRWITHRIAYQQLPEVFPSLLKPETGVLKAIVEF